MGVLGSGQCEGGHPRGSMGKTDDPTLLVVDTHSNDGVCWVQNRLLKRLKRIDEIRHSTDCFQLTSTRLPSSEIFSAGVPSRRPRPEVRQLVAPTMRSQYRI